MGVGRRLRMSPQLSCRMPSMHDRMVSYQTYYCMICVNIHIFTKKYNFIESYYDHWFALHDYRSTNWLKRHRPKQSGSIAVSLSRGFRCVGSAPSTRSSQQDWSPEVGHDSACNAPPDKPPGYYWLLASSTDSPDSNSKTLNNLNKRNRSLISKSRERSHRQGGRWGDKI